MSSITVPIESDSGTNIVVVLARSLAVGVQKKSDSESRLLVQELHKTES